MRIFNFLHGKKLIWTKHVRVYCDGGLPKNFLFPRFRFGKYADDWGMKGFAVVWLGREFNFSFGNDKNRLYKKTS